MRNCILGGDNFRAFRVDLGGQNSKGDNFQLYQHITMASFPRGLLLHALLSKAFCKMIFHKTHIEMASFPHELPEHF